MWHHVCPPGHKGRKQAPFVFVERAWTRLSAPAEIVIEQVLAGIR